MPRDKDTTYRIMSAVKSKNTSPERILGKAMWKMGLRYRKHYRIKGKADFVLVRSKIAVFCDGDFWHGNNWRIRGLKSLEDELSQYSDYWANKIKENIERDKRVNMQLSKEGWTVLRFWESEINIKADKIARKIRTMHRGKIDL